MKGSKWPTAYPDTMVTTNRVGVYHNFEYLVNLEERFGKHTVYSSFLTRSSVTANRTYASAFDRQLLPRSLTFWTLRP